MEHVAASIINVSWPQCFEALKNNPNAYLIDVRTEEEWHETGIADLKNFNKEVHLISWLLLKPQTHINPNFLEELMNAINDKQAKLYFICRSGGRSAQAAQASIEAGYQYCFNVEDGFTVVIERKKS